MKTRNNTHQNKAERGVAIVEAAVILVMFFMFLFGIFEAGRFLNTKQVLTNAAREGARLAVTPMTGTDTLPTAAEVEARVDQYLAAASITGATVQVDPVNILTGSVTTTYTRVQVDKMYDVVTVASFFGMLNINLQAEALMRNETSN